MILGKGSHEYEPDVPTGPSVGLANSYEGSVPEIVSQKRARMLARRSLLALTGTGATAWALGPGVAHAQTPAHKDQKDGAGDEQKGLRSQPPISTDDACACVSWVNVKDYGATGDGSTDDTSAVSAAIAAAAGRLVYFPGGKYVLDGLKLVGNVSFLLDPPAVLLAKPNTSSAGMMAFNVAGSLRIRGGAIDGNKDNQTGRPSIITAHCENGKSIDIANVAIRNTVANMLYVQDFGGYVSITDCTFVGQKEADGVYGHASAIIRVISGQPGANGALTFNNNTCIGTVAPVVAGGSPGGLFLNNSTVGDLEHGNLSTLEAMGNYFYGYGLNVGGNDISPIHTYPTWGGARVIGNYFEGCGFCAISAKSAQDFVCADNVVVDGQRSTQNIATEGAISYVPGYRAGSTQRPRATITGNVVDNPGEEVGAGKQYCVAVHGTPTSYATDAVVANNVLFNGGQGIGVDYTENLTLANNIIVGAVGGAVGTEGGIRGDHLIGDVLISGNRIESRNGYGLKVATASSARIYAIGNTFLHTAPSYYACSVKGAGAVKFSGNTFNATSGAALSIIADGTTPVGQLMWDESNTVIAGATSFVWSNITKATGDLRGSGSPQGVVTAGEVGTTYRQVNGVEGGLYWRALRANATSWAPVTDGGSAGLRPVAAVLPAAGTGASASVNGTDAEGQITVTGGNNPTLDALIVRITFAQRRASAPRGVLMTPANRNAAVLGDAVLVDPAALQTTGFSLLLGHPLADDGSGLRVVLPHDELTAHAVGRSAVACCPRGSRVSRAMCRRLPT